MKFLEQFYHQMATQRVSNVQVDAGGFTYRWLGIGVLAFEPNHTVDKAVIISAGIHGNETAPIELLDAIITDIFSKKCQLNVSLLVILGNPDAIIAGKRYMSADLNRMFSGKYPAFEKSRETERANDLESIVEQFYSKYKAQSKYHFDMHTAIRASHYPKFVLLPYQKTAYNRYLLDFFRRSQLDAVVFHQAPGGTFSQFTASQFTAASCTLELGKAKPFGQNDLTLYQEISQSLLLVISDDQLEQTTVSNPAVQIDFFQVHTSLIKSSQDFFKLHVKDDCPNFTVFYQGDCLLEQTIKGEISTYTVTNDKEWILFPNPNVALGLRAGMLLTQLSNENAYAQFVQ